MKKEDFPGVLNDLSKKGFEDNLKSGFKRCGVYSFDKDAIPQSVFTAFEVFNLGEDPNGSQTETNHSTANLATSQPTASYGVLGDITNVNRHGQDPVDQLVQSISGATSSNSDITSPSLGDYFVNKLSSLLEKPELKKAKEKSMEKQMKRTYGVYECLAYLQEMNSKKTKPSCPKKKDTYKKRKND